MTFEDYQDRAMKTAYYMRAPIPWLYPALALAEESGEVSGKLAKIIRDKGGVITDDDRMAIRKELGDVLWQLTALGQELGLDLHDIALTNVWKVENRAAMGTIHGEGDDR
jgi:NTP pyrophosphatase (non-canonical NTP hydrolase)